jgi:hypothetical protein
MKKLILGVICLGFLFTGCATDGAYNVGKSIYKGGKVVVQELPLKEDTKEKLSKVDKVATTYDKARTAVRNQLDDAGKKQDADTSKATEQ